LKKPHPTTKGQDKTKAGTKQEQPWIVQGSKKNNKQLQKTTTNNNNYKQQLMKTYSSAVSSVGPPLSLSKGDHQPDHESVTATAANIANTNLSVDEHRRRSMTSTIDNSPALNNRGINQDKAVTTATATDSLLQKPLTLAAANLGSCDKNPGKADTILDMGAFVGKKEGNPESWADPRGDGAKSGWGVDKGGIRLAAGKFRKN
jgi:hypothetical protein